MNILYYKKVDDNMAKWSKEKRRASQIKRGCTFRTVSSLKENEHVVILHHNYDWHYDERIGKCEVFRKPYAIDANVINVDNERRYVAVVYLDDYKSRNADIPFEQCIAAYNPDSKMLHFKGLHGNSDILIPE